MPSCDQGSTSLAWMMPPFWPCRVLGRSPPCAPAEMRWDAHFQTAPRIAVRRAPALVDSGRLARPKSGVPDGGAARKMTPHIMGFRRNDLRAVDIELQTGSNRLRRPRRPETVDLCFYSDASLNKLFNFSFISSIFLRIASFARALAAVSVGSGANRARNPFKRASSSHASNPSSWVQRS
jgi:hypothetical protein